MLSHLWWRNKLEAYYLTHVHAHKYWKVGAAAGSGDGAGRGIKLIPGTEILPRPPSKYLQLPVADPGFGWGGGPTLVGPIIPMERNGVESHSKVRGLGP